MSGNSVEAAANAEWRRRQYELPGTSTAGLDTPGRPADRVFDPALKHFASGYRVLDTVVDPALRPAWQAARRTALDVVAHGVARSGWADSLVLRGSTLMSGWFGAAAREPHDLDFVVVPQDWGIEEPRTGRLLAAVAEAAERAASEHGLVIAADAAVSEDIWTYERVPGRRLVLPWSAPGLPGGQVQLDFVFNERLPAPPEPADVSGVRLQAATPELSLAWKLVWLATDMYPQGKDLYDAVLLAERCTAPYELVRTVFRESGEFFPPEAPWDAPVTLEAFSEVKWADWDTFRSEYPGLPGSAESYAERLLAALAPTFEAGAG
ncbi:nucleotidyl transferase AbiEii/AbiGii toxin family protein [Streptomyces sp. MB09-01]|uniref:nucleotidyl transferase AbiEii/AbiGii toxin family protein n=1 Tax=Streptomyces sp. MB09-01 TaxID=3028666 RepID=UPI0029AD98DA|nr:nucleotidyl transferase AbiEii/AbiGii toxin family protein [Streptomyces sp. MB09-01]MDX3537927.1 nucleotidyl transferase AbiEii/AbiGii toxin family protein [Streptomyces sp. MB09-01]